MDHILNRLRIGTPSCINAAPLLFALCFMTAGCFPQKYIELEHHRWRPQKLQAALSGPDEPDERSLQVLRRYDLVRLGKPDSDDVINALADVYRREPGLELAYALAELNYSAGRRSELFNKRRAIERYVGCLAYAYLYLFAPDFDGRRSAWDPQFRGVCDLYNSALERCLRTAQQAGVLRPGSEATINTCQGPIRFTCEAQSFQWRDGDLDRFEFVADYRVVGLPNRYRTFGLGVPLIAVRRDPERASDRDGYYPRGLSFPVTAFLRWTPSVVEGEPDAAVLELYDPLEKSELMIADRRIPLESDITTPLAYYLQNPELQKLDTYGFLRPDRAEKIAGLYMLQPYQPGKIPVLMVHGLLSSPMTWMEVLNDLRSMPEIRDRFQFWFYLYPTGESFWESAADLREELAAMRRVLDPSREQTALDQMVVVGHSMGGLISRLVTLNGGDEYWDAVSSVDFDQAGINPAAREQFERAWYFQSVPEVRRVVTIASPHRGSGEETPVFRDLLRHVVTLPERSRAAAQALLTDDGKVFRHARSVPITSLDSLAPNSEILQVLADAPNAPGVRYHNIVGMTDPGGLSSASGRAEGDGLVSFASAHRDDVESEIIVQATHTDAHRHPLTILELRRILLEHLRETDAGGVMRIETVPSGNPSSTR